jgi:hypothetical protein
VTIENRPNKRTPSTTSEWEWRKIRRRPTGPQQNSAEGVLVRQLPVWDRREPLTLTVRYRGGGEAWIEIKGRGATLRVPGSLCIFDALSQMWGEHRP